MEHHEAVYEQIIEVNNTNQSTEFMTQHLVQEVVVRNDNNQETAVNCEMSGIEIMLSNDCVSEQDQCNSNDLLSSDNVIGHEKLAENVILQEPSKDESIQINNVDENITSYNENDKEVQMDLVLDNQTPYHEENFDVNSSDTLVVNQATGNKEVISETITDTSESVPLTIVNESVLEVTHNESADNHNVLNNGESITDNLKKSEEKNLKDPEQELEEPLVSENVTETVAKSIQEEKVEPMEVETVSIMNENVTETVVVTVEESQIQSENYTVNEEQEKEGNISCSNEGDVNFKSGETYSGVSPEVLEKIEYPVLITETITETKIISNSDDVAVLTEFSSIEYNTQEEIVEEPEDIVHVKIEENHSEFPVSEQEPQECTETRNANSTSSNSKQENVSTKSTDNSVPMEKDKHDAKSNDASTYEELENDEEDEEEDELDLHLSAQSTDTHRKVIQDIFDDWQDENGEEDNQFKEQHDSVEMELQHLLNDGAQQEETIASANTIESSVNSCENYKSPEQGSDNSPGKVRILKSEKVSPLTKSGVDSKTASNKSPKSISNYASTKDQTIGRSPKTPNQDHSQDAKQKLQSPRPGVKIPGLHLTSQIASSAEVNEVLKERLREKQKDLVVPKTADIVFVKKITQRLSSQLSAALTVPSLIPLQQQQQQLHADESSDKNKSSEELSVEPGKTTSTTAAAAASDSKELLAILEGDVDPDWSNLKPQSVTEESSNKVPNSEETHSTGSKLDPVIERELALKQLLELPTIVPKKNSPAVQKKTKRSSKLAGGKGSSDQVESKTVDDDDELKAEVISLDSAEEDSPKKEKTTKAQKENNNQNTRSSATAAAEIGVEESRSGRKRKLTEKAREHELAVKRQKVYKGKVVAESKKSSQETPETGKQKTDVTSPTDTKEAEMPKAAAEAVSVTSTPKSSQAKAETKLSKSEAKLSNKLEAKTTPAKPEAKTTPTKPEAKQTVTKAAEGKASAVKGKMTPVKRPKLGLLKKDAPISKRKLAVKNLLRQKVTNRKTAVAAKAKVQAAAAAAKTVSPSKNSTADKHAPAAPTTKAKKVTEIDRLLQDEGVVNLLYDVEQPDTRKRLVPITKSQKKIMDIDKAERELKLRTKLVRNAVLRLRNSGASAVKISPRSRRNVAATSSAEQTPTQSEKKSSEPTRSPKPVASTPIPADFIIPAKIRNAADASRIIRRHSSSSFSSASASPRVSVDLPSEMAKVDEPEVHSHAKSKRKLSHDTNEKFESKRGRKKNTPKVETETTEKSSAKKETVKKVMTRSNVVAPMATADTTAKTVPKNKKVPKSKGSNDSTNDIKTSPKGQDELSACLAEAASALLSSISGTSRTSNTSTSRKKGSTNVAKSLANDDEKVDVKKLFSNKEINVRQHGHLVQLILTPSTPVSGIRNAITIQVMNELREALSILKKDDDCRVVLFTSTGTSFCEGLELSHLLHSNKEERKIRAEEMANAVKEFIRALASFNKPIVAGVQGAAIGLGVTMLPLFDLVIASDKATFCTPYGKLGQIAEGAAVLTLSHSLGSAVTNELLLGGRILTASEALRAGLVTRVLWPDRFQCELLPSLKAMSEQSSQSMEATKALLRHSLRNKLDVALESETFLLIQHWCSLECQEAIKVYIDEKGQ